MQYPEIQYRLSMDPFHTERLYSGLIDINGETYNFTLCETSNICGDLKRSILWINYTPPDEYNLKAIEDYIFNL